MSNTNAERMAELTAKVMAQVAAKKAAHVHSGTGTWIIRCECGARRHVSASTWTEPNPSAGYYRTGSRK